MGDPLKKKSFDFAIKIVQLTKDLERNHKEYVLSRQLLRSGTGIGALIREAEFGRSKADFSNKLCIALKEANETDYWLSLLRQTEYLNETRFKELHGNCDELIAILVSSVKTSSK